MSTAPQNSRSRKDAAKPALTVIPKVIKGDTYLVLSSAAYQPDDEFINLYFTANNKGGTALKPPFEPRTLKHAVRHNNVLAQCVEAMAVNIDGTGHEFVAAVEGEEPNEQELAVAEGFFAEPLPGQSFVGMRRDLRMDIESVGYGYLEVLSSIDGTLAGLRYQDCTSIRMLRLDDPVQVTKSVVRGGKETTMTYWDRERRFVQIVSGSQRTYFREFGSTRQLNRDTGVWETPEMPVPPELRASELLFFGAHKDHLTPYCLPRWINELPSVLGSRKAEEQNLEFFDAGGMPPAIVFIQGGSMVGPAADQLRTYLSAQNKNKGRAIVVELASTSGSLESSSSVSAKVERFGAQQANDSMFSKYDVAAEEHVRIGFRLPPLFIGRAEDYSFATAQTSYMVAEAQVFQPEREEFDEVINKTLMRALGLKTIKFKSKPIVLKSAEDQLAGLEMIKDMVEGEELVSEVNKVTGLSMTYSKEAHDAAKEAMKPPAPVSANPGGNPKAGPDGDVVSRDLTRDGQSNLPDLARKYAVMTGRAVLKGDAELSPAEEVETTMAVDQLSPAQMKEFLTLLEGYTSAHHCSH